MIHQAGYTNSFSSPIMQLLKIRFFFNISNKHSYFLRSKYKFLDYRYYCFDENIKLSSIYW